MYPNKHLVTHILTTFSKTYPKIGAILVYVWLLENLKEMRGKENKEEKKKVKENKK